MPFASDIRYLYDGSFEGFLSCVFDAVYSRTVPVDICEQSIAQPSFYQDVWVSTDLEHAQRVYDSIPKKICPDAAELVRDAFCSCVPQKELLIFRFLIFGYRYGKQVYYMRSHARVAPLYEAQRHLHNEAHLLQGFVRFTDTGRALVAKITPKNFVLPYLAPHFCERYATEDFLIYDDTHGVALMWKQGVGSMLPLEALEMSPVTEKEAQMRALWKSFYQTIAIKERENPVCRRTHCPMRYWSNMTEFLPEVPIHTPQSLSAPRSDWNEQPWIELP